MEQKTNWFRWVELAIVIASVIAMWRIGANSLKTIPGTNTKTIEKQILSKEADINNYSTLVYDEKKIIAAMEKRIDAKFATLEMAKNSKDTVLIIRIQDTLLQMQNNQIQDLFSVVNYQDSIIVAQRYIINSKDTIISTYKIDNKKLKRQRNWSIILNAILGAAVIIK